MLSDCDLRAQVHHLCWLQCSDASTHVCWRSLYQGTHHARSVRRSLKQLMAMSTVGSRSPLYIVMGWSLVLCLWQLYCALGCCQPLYCQAMILVLCVGLQHLLCTVDKRGVKSKVRPRFIKQDQTAIVRLEAKQGVICLEAFKDFPQMGRFTLRDEGKCAVSCLMHRLLLLLPLIVTHIVRVSCLYYSHTDILYFCRSELWVGWDELKPSLLFQGRTIAFGKVLKVIA